MSDFLPPPLIPTDIELLAEAELSTPPAEKAATEPSQDEAPAEKAEPAVETAVETANADAPASDHGKATPAADAAEGDAAKTDIPADMAPLPSEEAIREALHVVTDPEIGISIMELGLVYDVIRDEAEHTVTINMTLTSPGCPLGPEMTSAVYLTVTRMPGVRDCHVELVWTPMWDPQVNATEETRIALGLW